MLWYREVHWTQWYRINMFDYRKRRHGIQTSHQLKRQQNYIQCCLSVIDKRAWKSLTLLICLYLFSSICFGFIYFEVLLLGASTFMIFVSSYCIDSFYHYEIFLFWSSELYDSGVSPYCIQDSIDKQVFDCLSLFLCT